MTKVQIDRGLITSNGATMWQIVRAWVAWVCKKGRK